ncbi:methyl-accepting chemotaxis protein [Hungatella hathewayi]|uniref:methyl-accepting chemotaxis protein n=1 Tax=Hungatella hathewayi TaxID=154046 RepID=UPI003561A01E
MKRSGNHKVKTVQEQILGGYVLFIVVIIFLVIISMFCLFLVSKKYQRVSAYQQQQYAAQEAVTAHYQWLEQLSDAITTGSEFEGSLNPETCVLGRWLYNTSTKLNGDFEIAEVQDKILGPHREIHLEAASLVAQGKLDQEGAYEIYKSEFKPKVEEIGQGLEMISRRYQESADAVMAATKSSVLYTNILLIFIGIAAIQFSIITGRKRSIKISEPILAVARWSEELSTGVDNLLIDFQGEDHDSALEIRQMIDSFRVMANGIREHARIIQQVADGDLTACVEIRSDGDSLGKNLYHLVSNNDCTLSALQITANSVASTAKQVESASQALADGSANQASAVEALNVAVSQAAVLAVDNADSSEQAAKVISEMGQVVKDEQERINGLANEVAEISKASEKIAFVMKSINEIAFQTNVLALNAAVESARAGKAGKGFGVVAKEVRILAEKSAKAADQSQMLIEDAILKAESGRRMAFATLERFREVVTWTTELTGKMIDINKASHRHQEYMSEIREKTACISAVVTNNAAFSEETAAASQEMNTGFESIRNALCQFKLRSRS